MYIYIYAYIYMHMYMHMCMYINREREREQTKVYLQYAFISIYLLAHTQEKTALLVWLSPVSEGSRGL